MTTIKKIAVLSLLALAACAQSLPQDPPNWEEISNREGAAFDQYGKEVLGCEPLDVPTLQEEQRAWLPGEILEKMGPWNKQMDALLDQWGRCQVEAGVRLKVQLWLPAAVRETIPSNTVSPNWNEISQQNYAAVERYRSEARACQLRYVGPDALKEEGAAADRSGPGSVAWHHYLALLDQAFDEVRKCNIEAAARLKPQLWSP